VQAADSASPSADRLRAAFDAPSPLTLGVEEEVMLLHPDTLDLHPCADAVLGRLAGDVRFKAELPAAQLEILTAPLASPADVERELRGARADLVRAADGLARVGAAGVHPFAAAEGELNGAPRYAHIREEYGPMARRQLVFALQVHVAVRGADRALAVYNALRSHLPEIAALAANAPLHGGADSGLASVRPTISDLLPRQGVPPALASWEELATALDWGARAGVLPEYRLWWWELRPHPLHGTLEVRVPDAQVTAADSAAVVAVVHALAAHLVERHDAGEALDVAPTWRIEENRWSALRHGLGGELADLRTGARRPTRERVETLIDALGPVAQRLGGSAQLEHARTLLAANGAERQREVAAQRGVPAAVEWLAGEFAST
jgi:carboxylate-amine ligase